MSKNILLAGVIAVATALGSSAAFAQAEPAPTMTVYLGNLPAYSGSTELTVDVPLPAAAEACGVDLKFIEAWAVSEPRYCVALHAVEALDAASSERPAKPTKKNEK